MPRLPEGAEVWRIEQGYLDSKVTPRDISASALVGRIRSILYPDGSIRYFNTVKTGAGLVRRERELELTREQFQKQWPRTEGRRLVKTRYRVPVGENVWEVDVFDGIELAMAEIELADASSTVIIPDWLKAWIVREVTDDPAYTNASIAARLGRQV
jgi:CYTH domain-containing protein